MIHTETFFCFNTIKIKLKMCFVTKSLTFKQLGPRHAVLSAREDWLYSYPQSDFFALFCPFIYHADGV